MLSLSYVLDNAEVLELQDESSDESTEVKGLHSRPFVAKSRFLLFSTLFLLSGYCRGPGQAAEARAYS
jgi:hypothetical protein